jgi:glycosyltransferase involved in cell wall biosynthesis
MRILYLHQYFTLPSGAGGTRSYEMSRRLVAAGHRVTVITSTANLGEIFPPAAGWQTREVEGVHLEAVGVPYDNTMSFIERIRAFVRFAAHASWHAWKSDPDVVFATSTPLTIIIPALAVSLRRRVPLVFEVRDLWPELPIAVGALRHPLLKTAARCLEWIAYRASTHVVALSPGMARGVMRRGIPASKVTLIPNGCDVALFDVPAGNGDWVRQRLGMTPGQPLVVYAGAFGLVNGWGYLVDTAAAMEAIAPEVRFLLVGSGAEADKLKARAERAGILDRSLWVWPPMPKSQVPGLMAAATIAVSAFIPLKALQDNSANKFFDALAAGKPVAVNHEGWQADILRKSAAGIVLPADDAAKAAVLLSDFLHDPDRLKRASAASRRLARDVFSRDLLAARLARVLEAAAGKRPIGEAGEPSGNPAPGGAIEP